MSTIHITFNGEPIVLDDISLTETTLTELADRLFELTNVPPPVQKLLWKGKKPRASPDSTLEEAGMKSGAKIVLIGTPITRLNEFKQAESEANRRQAIIAKRAAAGPSKVLILHEIGYLEACN